MSKSYDIDHEAEHAMACHNELLTALTNLQKQLHAHVKMNVRKDFYLLLADAAASTAIHNATKVGVSA